MGAWIQTSQSSAEVIKAVLQVKPAHTHKNKHSPLCAASGAIAEPWKSFFNQSKEFEVIKCHPKDCYNIQILSTQSFERPSLMLREIKIKMDMTLDLKDHITLV